MERLTAAHRTRNDAGGVAARPVNGVGWQPTEGPDLGYRAAVIRNARRRAPRAQAVARVIVASAAAAVKWGAGQEDMRRCVGGFGMS